MKSRWWLVGVAGLVVLGTLLLFLRERSRTELRFQAGFLPGNPQRGGELFQERSCARCHAIGGIGGGSAPDLARAGRAPSDIVEIAGAMWNHAPEMWREMAKSGYPPPRLTPRDAADVMAFLFMAGYLQEGGNPSRGDAVLARKRCRECHATGEAEQKIGPDLARWSESVNPILWAQLSWNHSPKMHEAMKEEGIAWPELSPSDVADLIAFLRSISKGPVRAAPIPGDPWVGKSLFRENCRRCHRAEGQGGDVGPDLEESPQNRSLSALAAALWNHSPAMTETMKELGVERTVLSEQEMSDLVTYLFAIRYFQIQGDPDEGRRFYDRSCSACHGENGRGGVGPSLRSLGARASATYMVSALWNHGPRMYQELKKQGREWPRIEGDDMRNLISYLRSLSQSPQEVRVFPEFEWQ